MGILVKMLALILPFTYCGIQYDWPQWQQFKQYYLSDDGRVIDSSDPAQITTSEGQSYALFFALVANDRPTFDKLLYWTENHLAAGDLATHLPAWLWGFSQEKQQWMILDDNSAADADLWIAYDLIEAGRLWKNPHYQILGTMLLNQIALEEVANIPGLGIMLLPGKTGFHHDDDWRLNPSYLPPQLLARFATLQSTETWREVEKNTQRLLVETSPQGFAPDWVIWNKTNGWQPDAKSPNLGSYNAIRVYLWVGMLTQDRTLQQHFQPMITVTQKLGFPPENINTATAKTTGVGPVGFSAALLPLLANDPINLALQQRRVTTTPWQPNHYYSAVLTLYGQGWQQHRYRFNSHGELLPSWNLQCVTSDFQR